MSAVEAHLIYALAWLSFGFGHSLLAGQGAKQALKPSLGPFYRLAYNLFATVHLVLILWIGHRVFGGGGGYDLPHVVTGLGVLVSILGWALLVIGLGGYDLGRLAGTHQIRCWWRHEDEPEDEPLRTDGLHRYVRHPLYAAGFLILWGPVDGAYELATALWGSLYLVVGAWFEERRLYALYGAAYAAYRARVPAFIPWRGRALDD